MPRFTDTNRPKSGPGSALSSTSLHVRSRGFGGRNSNRTTQQKSERPAEDNDDSGFIEDGDDFVFDFIENIGNNNESNISNDNVLSSSSQSMVKIEKMTLKMAGKNEQTLASPANTKIITTVRDSNTQKKAQIEIHDNIKCPAAIRPQVTDKVAKAKNVALNKYKRIKSSKVKKEQSKPQALQSQSKSLVHQKTGTKENNKNEIKRRFANTITPIPNQQPSSNNNKINNNFIESNSYLQQQHQLHGKDQNATYKSPHWINIKRAIAIDTRSIETFTGEAAGRTFSNHTLTFLKTCARRGLLPSILGVTVSNDPRKSSVSTSFDKLSSVTGGSSGFQQEQNQVGVTFQSNTTVVEVKATHLPIDILTGFDVDNHVKNCDGGIGSDHPMQPQQRSATYDYSGDNNHSYKQKSHQLLGQSYLSLEEEQDIWESLLLPVSIRLPINVGNEKNRKSANIPKSLLGYESWRIFGDFVDSIAFESSRISVECASKGTSAESKSTSALDISIFTNDVSFFTDKDIESHKRGLNSFWDRIRVYFKSNVVQSITIFLVETGAIALEISRACISAPVTRDTNISKKSGQEDSGRVRKEKTDQRDNSTISGYDYHTTEPISKQTDAYQSNKTHRFEMLECIRSIQNQITALSANEYTNNPRNIHCNNRKEGTPMSLQLQIMDCHPITYHSVLQQWTCKLLTPSSVGSGRICFDLPETMDGTQCTITLDLSYIILPHRIDSLATEGLIFDMKLLGSSFSRVEVVQLIPLSSVDASLIYGVPMSAKAAMEGNLSQYKEIQILVRQLWKYLGLHDLAMVLRCTTPITSLDGDWLRSIGFGRREYCGYQSHDQLFILMAEEIVSSVPNMQNEDFEDGRIPPSKSTTLHPDFLKRGFAPGNGVLYRYAANADQLLRESTEHDFENEISNLNDQCNEEMREMSQIYFEYVESSLECLDRTGLNPFVKILPKENYVQNVPTDQQKSEKGIQKENIGHAISPEIDPWQEDCGVGVATLEITTEK